MTKQTIGVGAVADDGTGDPARTAFTKVNANFSEIYGISGIVKANGSTTVAAADAGTDYANLAFKTVAVSGQSDVVADSAADTLTLAEGSGITITTNASTDTVTVASSGPAYGSGSGGTVTQATSKSTGVTLNKACGQITMNNAIVAGFSTVAGYTSVSFTLTNSTLAANDLVHVVHSSGGTAGSYAVQASDITAGSCKITVTNLTAAALAEAIVLTFAVIKAVSA